MRQDRIIHDYLVDEIRNLPKNIPEKVVVKHSVLSFRLEVILGIGMTILPVIFFYRISLKEIVLAFIITAVMGGFVIYSAFQKKANHNYILDKNGITINGEFVYWHEVEKAIKLIPKKKKPQHEFLRLSTKLKTYDIWLSPELRPKPKQIEEYVAFIMKARN